MLCMARAKVVVLLAGAAMLPGSGVGALRAAAAEVVRPGAPPAVRTPPVAATPGGIVFTGHTSPVTHVSASADASVLVSAGLEDGLIRVWDVSSRRCVQTIKWRNANLGYIFGKPTIKVPPGWTPVLALSPDGRWIAAAEECTADERKAGKPDARLRLIEVITGKDVHQIEVRNQPNVRLSPRYVAAVAFSPDSAQVAVSTWAGSLGDPAIDLWEVKSGKHVRLLARPKYGACSVAYSPDGKRLAFTNGRVAGGCELGKPDDQVRYESQRSVKSIVFSRDAAKLVGTDSNGGLFMVWDAATGKCEHSGAIAALRNDRRLNLGLTGRDLLTAGSGADLFDLRGAGGLAHVLTVGKMAPGNAFTYAAWMVNDVLLHPDGRRAILACGDGSVRIESLCPNGVKAAQDAGELGTTWTTLGAKDAQAAYWATWTLGLSGERAVKAIASRLDEAGGAGDRFAGLLKQLNDASPQVREQAEQKLGQSGLPGAVAMLAALEALPQAPSEPRERIAGALATIELRWCRAVRVLELIGSAESRQLLVRIAKSHPLAEAKQDAAAVLAAQERAAARFKQ